jgi:hypothetical protein
MNFVYFVGFNFHSTNVTTFPKPYLKPFLETPYPSFVLL